MGGNCAFTQHLEIALFPREQPGVPGNLRNWEKQTHELKNPSFALIVSTKGTGSALSSWGPQGPVWGRVGGVAG